MRIDSLLRMSQQIARNMQAFPDEEAAERVASHLHSFWTPVMIAELRRQAEDEPDSVDPIVREALTRLV